MATRSLIAVELNNSIIKAIYCHWDGYPEGVGMTLVNHYNTPAKITELMEMGDISSLGDTVKDSIFYHRDRKEPWGMVEPRDMWDVELRSVANDHDTDYYYVYTNENEWECCKNDGTQIDILSGKVALNQVHTFNF